MFPVKKAEENKFILTASNWIIPPGLSVCVHLPSDSKQWQQALVIWQQHAVIVVFKTWDRNFLAVLFASLVPCLCDSPGSCIASVHVGTVCSCTNLQKSAEEIPGELLTLRSLLYQVCPSVQPLVSQYSQDLCGSWTSLKLTCEMPIVALPFHSSIFWEQRRKNKQQQQKYPTAPCSSLLLPITYIKTQSNITGAMQS